MAGSMAGTAALGQDRCPRLGLGGQWPKRVQVRSLSDQNATIQPGAVESRRRSPESNNLIYMHISLFRIEPMCGFFVLTVWHAWRKHAVNKKLTANAFSSGPSGGAVSFAHRVSMSTVSRGRYLFLDLLVVGLASIAALALRENFALADGRWGAFVPYLLFTLAISGPILIVLELDRSVWRFSGLADYGRVAFASVLIVIGAVATGFVVNRLDGVARSLPVLQAVLMAAGLIGTRVLTRVAYERRRRAGGHTPLALPRADDTVLLVGWSSLVELYVRSAAEFGSGQIHIAGILSPHERHVGRLVQAIRVLGTPEDADKILTDLDVHGVHVGRILIATSLDRLSDEAQRVLREIESTTDVRLEFFAERLGLTGSSEALSAQRQESSSNAKTDVASALAVEEAEFTQALRRPYWRLKRMIDVAVALTLILVLSPLILLVALFVALDVGLPVLFVQQRPGLRGARFNLYKFRTMSPPHDRAGLRVSDEARISWVGAFVRRTRLDELPQLFNILFGDMSFVGPRPLVAREQSRDVVARLLVRPGLTGWAQVHGGRTVSVADKTALDIWYVRHASLMLDLRVVFATVPMVLFGERVDGDVVRLAWRDLHGLEGRGQVRE